MHEGSKPLTVLSGVNGIMRLLSKHMTLLKIKNKQNCDFKPIVKKWQKLFFVTFQLCFCF